MTRHLLIGIVLVSALVSTGAAQSCDSSVFFGTPISGQNLDPYTAVGQVKFLTEGPNGTFSCTLNVNASRAQHYLVLQYVETWRWSPTYLQCGVYVNYCKNTMTISLSGPGVSDTVTLSDDGTTRPPPDTGPAWRLLASDFTGEVWGRTVKRKVDISAATQSSDATIVFSVTDVVPTGSYTGSVGGTFMAGRLASFVDPVPDLQSRNQVLTDPEALATLGTRITGVAADGASRVVLRIPARWWGQSISITLLNDQGGASDPAKDGTLTTIQGTPSSGNLQVLAFRTSQGPMAFVIYKPPTDFSRGGNDDTAINRIVQFQIQQLGTSPPTIDTEPLTIWRPPVVLVHGLWGSTADWNTFTPFMNDSRFSVSRADYDYATNGITSSTPNISNSKLLAKAETNSLGFDYNAPLVLWQIKQAIVSFRQATHAAATQADVVGHSMGGTITRTLENRPEYTSFDSFGVGNVHKLITIGTPHLGSPLAIQLIQQNQCLRDLLAGYKKFTFYQATVEGVSGISGGVGDLQGDGHGGLSVALNAIQNANGHEVPTALIVGVMASNNLASLNCTLCVANYVRHKCSGTQGDTLAVNLTPVAWPTVFGQDSDSVVPISSQMNRTTNGPSMMSGEVSGVIHSAGMEDLSFTGPSEIDPGNTNTVQALVIQFLNASTQNQSIFFKLP